MAGSEAVGFLSPVADYYTAKLASHGATAQGVDWNSAQSQLLRFAQFGRLLPDGGAYSLNDIGCGYGGLLAYLRGLQRDVDYLGIDISTGMVEAAQARARGDGGARFLVGTAPDRVADYCVASGIFSVKLEAPVADWQAHVLRSLEAMHAWSRRGFAFNCLTSYADAGRMRPGLYYADPLALFDHCKRRYGRDVALLHDYGLYEFTLIVRKGE